MLEEIKASLIKNLDTLRKANDLDGLQREQAELFVALDKLQRSGKKMGMGMGNDDEKSQLNTKESISMHMELLEYVSELIDELGE